METSGKALASLLLAPSILASSSAANAASEPPIYADTKRTILLTGCNSGIGYDAAKRLAQRGHDIILACRTLDKATGAANQIQEELGTALTGNLLPKECNLADLTSIASLVQELNTSGTKLDSLCLNAGIARNTAAKEVLYTSQGFELTIGTNHLGHFYLTNMLLPLLKTDGMGSNIVVTASGVHDPDSPGGAQGSLATLGDLEGLEKSVKENVSFDMVDGNAFDPDKAYKDSKVRVETVFTLLE
jgi:protochlorophyllide reductase